MMGYFYDQFAESFSNKRRNPWKAFVNFMKSLETEKRFQKCVKKGIWCDLGTGNGRHLPILTNYTHKYVGIDQSFKLLCIARSQNDPHKLHNWIACDVNALPFRKNTFQCIVSVAVLHHITKKNQLRQVLQKIKQILSDKGLVILTLWGARGGKYESKVKRQNFHHRFSKQNIIDRCSKTEQFELDVNEALIPWTTNSKGKNKVKKPRIYYLYHFNGLIIYHEFFEILRRESIDMGKNAGINYFVCLVK